MAWSRAPPLFEAAAAKDHAGAQFALGALLGGGYDVLPDRVAAQAWFAKAAAKNHAHALLMLGRYLARGLAGEPDKERARALLERANAAGIAEAANDLATLAPPPPVAALEPKVAAR